MTQTFKHNTVYRITNTINKMIYIGSHKTDNLNDGYPGSGVDLKKAKKEFGKDNFVYELLFDYDNEKDMKVKEKELIDYQSPSTYNKHPGSVGGHQGDTKSCIEPLKDEDGLSWVDDTYRRLAYYQPSIG